MALKTTNILSQLPNELTVQKVEKQPHFIEIFILYPDPEERICPKCGSHNCVIKDRRVQTVHHVPLNKTGTALTFKRIRFKCKDFDATFSDTPYWLHPSLHMTTDLYLSIWVDLTAMHSKKDIALNNCVTVSIVESVINELSITSIIPCITLIIKKNMYKNNSSIMVLLKILGFPQTILVLPQHFSLFF